MRKLLALAALAASMYAGAPVPRNSGEFVLNMVDGPQQLLTAYRGKTVVLALMYATCPHCQKAAQTLIGVQKEYAAKGVQVLGATFGKGDEMRVQQFSKGL